MSSTCPGFFQGPEFLTRIARMVRITQKIRKIYSLAAFAFQTAQSVNRPWKSHEHLSRVGKCLRKITDLKTFTFPKPLCPENIFPALDKCYSSVAAFKNLDESALTIL